MTLRIIGVGDNTADDYTHLRTLFPGGNALNVAVYAAQLGCEAAYLGVFGNDAIADHMRMTLTELDVDNSRCCRADGPSGRATLAIEAGERVFTGSNEGGVRKSVSMQFIFEDDDYLRSFPIAHTSRYSFIDEHLQQLRSLVPMISYDFSDDFDPEHALAVCEYVDIGFFSCSEWPEEAVVDYLQRAVSKGCRVAVATRGAREAILFDGESLLRQAPQPVTPIDTLGAGDAFIAGFLVASCGALTGADEGSGPMAAALEKAAAFAAETCVVQGAFGHGLRY